MPRHRTYSALELPKMMLSQKNLLKIGESFNLKPNNGNVELGKRCHQNSEMERNNMNIQKASGSPPDKQGLNAQNKMNTETTAQHTSQGNLN